MRYGLALHPKSLCRNFAAWCVAATVCISGAAANAQEVKDLKYGAILFQFFQQHYFDTLVEYAYAEEKGGISGHGNYPELLKGGVSLSYGLDVQAENIFTRVVEGNVSEQARNRAWFYLGKMQYLRGDTSRAAANLANINGRLPDEIDPEYRYLAALVNIKLGYFDISDSIVDGFDESSPYAPYFYFNLGIAFGKHGEVDRSVNSLKKVIAYNGASEELSRLSDRAYMALSFLYAQHDDLVDSKLQLEQVKSQGAYSNRGLLGASWLAVNKGDFKEALAPLNTLASRSIALPEVQEAILLRPYVYEKLSLNGRAAKGFIDADTQYGEALDWIKSARGSLKQDDMMELFVRNLDKVLGESDWFGQAPSVSLNKLSPFLVELMSDHSFQSVLKDLRDLYAIRNNLRQWKARRSDFEVILRARAGGLKGHRSTQQFNQVSQQAAGANAKAQALANRVSRLSPQDRQKVQWVLDDLNYELGRTHAMLNGVKESGPVAKSSYQAEVENLMAAVSHKEKYANDLIVKLEKVMLTLVSTELDIHEQRLKHYQVEAQLAKVRILDRSLKDLDVSEPTLSSDEASINTSSVDTEKESGESQHAI